MALTLADVRARVFEGDVLAESPDQVTEDADGALRIAGRDDGEVFAPELLMRQEGDAVHLWSKYLDETDWLDGGLFRDFRELHIWVYEL